VVNTAVADDTTVSAAMGVGGGLNWQSRPRPAGCEGVENSPSGYLLGPISTDKAEIWVATQNSEASLAALSESSGVPLAKCEVYRHDLGGGFGRRGGPQDYVHQAVAIAQQFPGVPVKMIWSREEDMTHDFYRPISQCRGVAGLDADGNLVGLHVRVSGQSINAFSNPAGSAAARMCVSCRASMRSPATRSSATRCPTCSSNAMRNTHIPVGAWRGVNTNQNAVNSAGPS
jgi:isoquinoline 1-oxidoreductase beta subunit